MDLEQSISAFMAHRRDKGLSPESLTLYQYWFSTWCSWREKRNLKPLLEIVDAIELRQFFRYLETEHIPHSSNTRRPAAQQIGLKASSRDGCWRTLRAFWNWLEEEGLLSQQQLGLFKRDRVPRPRVQVDSDEDDIDLQADRAIDEAIVDALLAACGSPFTELAARNRAIILLLAESGMRVSELCRLNDVHIDVDNSTARVRGKGNKKRFVFWGPKGSAALRRYLALRPGGTGGKVPVFRGCSSTNQGLRLTRDAVRGTLKRLARRAGVTLPAGAPVHGFRSGFAQRMLDAGVDGLDLKQLLGHADIRTTTIYTQRHPKKLRGVHRRALGYTVPASARRRIT